MFNMRIRDLVLLLEKPIEEIIAKFIVMEVQKRSITNGFQYMVSFKEIDKKFGGNISEDAQLIEDVTEELGKREEVADVEIAGGFDVVLYTDYAPNYNEEDYK